MTLTKGKECKKCVNNYHCPEHCPYPEKCTDSDCAIARLNCHTPPPTEGIWMKPCRGCGKDIPATMDDIDHACPPPALPSDGLSQQKTCPTPTSEGWRERFDKELDKWLLERVNKGGFPATTIPNDFLFSFIEAERTRANEAGMKIGALAGASETRTATLHDLSADISALLEDKK